MKFGDKLIALRKKSGLSQEELAAKLNVSRQSVSKWEGNNSYPETDKIIQICNIFDCSMDDLINENISDLSTIERKSKNNLNIVLDSLLEFITKTLNMFSNMKFSNGLRCAIEMLIIIGILYIAGVLVTHVLTGIIGSLVSFLPQRAYSVINAIAYSVFCLLWLGLSLIVIVHIFKIRYLDYYDQIIDKKKKEENLEQEKQMKKITSKIEPKKEDRIVIRDAKQEPFAFLSILSKVIICFVKIIIGWIGLAFIGLLIALVIAFIICIPLCQYSLIFVGIVLGLLGGTIITAQIILLIIYFIMNKKNTTKVFIILFIASFALIGVGIGTSLIGIINIDYKENATEIMTFTVKEEEFDYEENMVLANEYYGSDFTYVVDNNLPEGKIKIATSYDPRFTVANYEEQDIYGMNGYFFNVDTKFNFKQIYKIITKDLKNQIFRDYESLYDSNMEITASEQTIKQLKDNFSKVYLYHEKETKEGIEISRISSKIESYNNECSADYNALSDTITCYEEECQCQRTDIQTSRGTLIEYTCRYKVEG